MHGAWADDGTKRLKFPRLSVSVPPVVAILACDAASGPGPRLGGIGWEASIGEIVHERNTHERNTRVRGAAGPGCPGSARQRRGGDGGRAPTRPTWGGAVGPHGWRAAGCPRRSPRRDTRARRGSSSPDNNPYNVRRCGRATWLAGSGLSPAVATAGPPGRDADRRAPTITLQRGAVRPATWLAGSGVIPGGRGGGTAGQGTRIVEPGQEPCTTWGVRPAAWLAGGAPSAAFAWAGQSGRDADRRAPTRTPYNVVRYTTWGSAPGQFGWRVARCPRAPSGRCGRAESMNRRHHVRTLYNCLPSGADQAVG